MAIRKCVFLNIANKDIILCWVPSHVGIRGNEKADSAAKSALDLPHAQVGVPYTDFKLLISQYIFSTWQDDWNGAVANRLHSVKPVLGDWQSSYRRCRKDEVVLCRARIGHTYMTHSYILKKDPPPQCPLRVWEPQRGAGVNILFENGQSPHNSSYEAPCLP